MRRCPLCGHKNPDSSTTCARCNRELGSVCPSCGQVVPPQSRFCNSCGARLAETSGASPVIQGKAQVRQALQSLMPDVQATAAPSSADGVRGERRQVTALYWRIVDYSVLAQSLDNESLYLLTDKAIRRMADIVDEYEGMIDTYTDDGLMVLFGLPVVHENDAERAVRAALDMCAAIEPLRRECEETHGVTFAVTVGIHTGPVIAGPVTDDTQMAYTVVGDTISLADLLQKTAQPGTVLVSFETYQYTRPWFTYQTVIARGMGDVSSAVKTFRPLRVRVHPGRVRGLPGLQVPMIGRQSVLKRLQDALDQVRQRNSSQVVLVTGEAGVGKSRLLAEFWSLAISSGIRLYQGGTETYARMRPLALVADVLRDMLHVSESDPPGAQRAALLSSVQRLDLAHPEVLPYVYHVLGLEQDDARMEARLRHLDDAVLQKLTHTALLRVFVRCSHPGPIIVVFEDLHWVDSASKEFLEHLVQAVGDAPMLVILVSRESERETVIQPLIAAAQNRDAPLIDIRLSPLSGPDCELLVDQLIPSKAKAAEELKNSIVARADGNPLFAEEIVRMLVDQGELVRSQDGWRVMPGAGELAAQTPGALNSLIVARLDHLPQDLRQTLKMLAVLGPSFPASLLGHFCDLSGEQADAQVESLLDRQFLVPSSQSPEQSYSFRHALIQEALYDTMLRSDRAKLHEKAGEAIEGGEHWPVDERSEALAHHFARSVHPARAVPHLLAAADRAARRCAYETAISSYRQALSLMRPSSVDARESVLYAQIGLGRALQFAGEYTEAVQILEVALNDLLLLSLKTTSSTVLDILIHGLVELANIHQREGAPDEALSYLEAGLTAMGENPAQEHPQLWRAVIDRMAWVRFRQGDLEGAFSLASSATLGLDPQEQDDPVTLASLYNTLGGILWQKGDLSEAIVYAELCLDLYHGLGYPWGMANAYTNLGILYYVQGEWPAAAESLTQAEQVQKEIADLSGRAVTLNNLGTLRQSMGEHELAQEDLETSLAIRERLGDTWGAAQAHVALARLSLVQSRYRDARAHLDAALAVSEDLGGYGIEARWILALLQAEEDLDTALATAEQALETSRERGFLEQEADCHRVLGVLHARSGDFLEAESLLRESADLCVQANAPYGHGLALFELGQLYGLLADGNDLRATEWRERALASLAEAEERFGRLGAAFDLDRVSALIDQIHLKGDAHKSPPVKIGSRDDARPIPLDRDLPEGEWRTATILWVLLEPVAGADEESVFEMLAMLIPSLTSMASESHGKSVRRPNGLMVVYGVPNAYEDDAERAVRTAHRMMSYLLETLKSTGAILRCSAAVSEGRVVAGRGTTAIPGELVITGEAVAAAASTAQSMPAGQIWVSDTVYQTTERTCRYESVSSALRSDLWALTGFLDQPVPARGLPGLNATLVGRDPSLQSMAELANKVNEGIGGLIWLEGEPGIGKSRLMREFAAQQERAGALVWTGGCSPQKSSVAFSLFSDLLACAFGVQPSDTQEQILARVDLLFRDWPQDAQVTRPYLELLLGLHPSGLGGERLLNLQPEQLRQQTFVSLRRLFKSLAVERPLVLLLDDLHWIDPVSAEAIQFLLTIVASSPVFFVCAQRRQGSDQPNERLLRLQVLIPTQTLQLSLERLSLEESGMLLNGLLGESDLPEKLRTLILQKGEGNPYFIEEFVRMLIDLDYLDHREDRWIVAPDVSFEEIQAPSTLHRLVRSRLDALPPELEQVVQCAAVLGAPFETAFLEAIVDHVDVPAALHRLESRFLVEQSAETGRWTFGHSLIEDVAYGGMLAARQRTLHHRVAVAMEERWAGSESDHAEVLAYHYVRADQTDKALTYLMIAGERAAARYANEEAIRYFEQAAEKLSQQSDAPDSLRWRLAAGLGDVYRSMGKYVDSTVALKAGLALTVSGNLDSAMTVALYRRMGETAWKQGELDVAAEHLHRALDGLQQPDGREAHREAARVTTALAWVHFLQGRLDQARGTCRESLDHAKRADALPELAAAENLMGGIYYRQRNLASALQHTRRAMVLREQMGYTWGVASTLGNLGVLAFLAGEWSKSWSFFERSLNLRQEVGDVAGIVISSNNLGILARDQGDLDLAELYFRQSLSVAEPFKMGYHIANSTIGLAQTLLVKGDLGLADEVIEAGVQQCRAIGADDLRAEAYRVQAEILVRRGVWDKAMDLAERSFELADDGANRELQASVWRVISEIELGQGDLPEASQAVEKAHKILEDVTNELETGRVAVQSGRIALAEGRVAEGETHLRHAQQTFVRLGAKPDLRRVEDILQQQAGGAGSDRSAAPDRL